MGCLNVNILLCEKCNEDTSNIFNIFNAVKLNKESKASFTIVTQINSFNEEFDKIGLFYFMEKCDPNGENSYIFLGRINIKKENEEKKISTGEPQLSSQDNGIQEIIHIPLKNVVFLGVGQYEIQVFLYRDEDIPQLDRDSLLTKELKRSLRKKDNLVSVYSFEAI